MNDPVGLPLGASCSPGKVYLVGAGPGDPELLTLKGRRLLERADVVIYDRLANPALLRHCRPGAELIYAGKTPPGGDEPTDGVEGSETAAQQSINQLLVEYALAGRTVCRLKGGDPFIFGRGGEEADALATAGIQWEYVPGVSSAVAVPGFAGIPATYRGLCSTLAIVTAHQDPGSSGVRWDLLAQAADTLVILMGAERLSRVVTQLLAHGRPPDTPCAVISWGTYPIQRTVEGALTEIVARCAEAGCTAPAVTVIGEVVRLRERLQWWESLPLFGARVAVTRPRHQMEGFAAGLERAGAEAIRTPAVRIEPIPVTPADLGPTPPDWVVFTSANGVRCLTSSLRLAGADLRQLGTARIACIGPETATAAAELGLHVDFVPQRFVAEGLIEGWPETVSGRRILIPRALEARDLLPNRWLQAGALVTVLPTYATLPDPQGLELLRRRVDAGTVDWLTFTASSTVRAVAEAVGIEALERIPAACIGPITAETARELGLRVEVEADEHTTEGLLAALSEYRRAGKLTGGAG